MYSKALKCEIKYINSYQWQSLLMSAYKRRNVN